MTDTLGRSKHLDLPAGPMVEFENPFGGKKALKRADRGYTGDQGIPITAVLAPESGCPPPSPPQTVGMPPLAPWWLSPRFPRHATEAAPAPIPLDKRGHPSPATCDLYPTQLVLSLF